MNAAARDAVNVSAAGGKGELVVLTAIAQHSDGVDREHLSVLTGYKRSTRDAYIQRLRASGLVEQVGTALAATAAGHQALGPNFTPLPTGRALPSPTPQGIWLSGVRDTAANRCRTMPQSQRSPSFCWPAMRYGHH